MRRLDLLHEQGLAGWRVWRQGFGITVPTHRNSRTYEATLCCGYRLTYEAWTFVPDVGEIVPCRRHGFCAVTSRDHGNAVSTAARRVRRRSQCELMTFLSHRPIATVHQLRRQRFSLRVVAAAEKAGLVDLDLLSGRVALRSGRLMHSAGDGRQ